MLRRLYTLLLYAALPFASLVIAVRGLRQPEYWRGWGARFGFGARATAGGLWVHAVSVGEVQAAAILIKALRAHSPQRPITLTTATPTGRARARELLPDVAVSYAPYDLPGCLSRQLRRLQPAALVVLETELWPNLLHVVTRAAVPILIASARISARSAERYARWPGLMHAALARRVWVGAQSAADAERFARLGVPHERLSVAGNIKFDRQVEATLPARAALWRAAQAPGRAIWVAGSTHALDEQALLATQRAVRALPSRPLLVLAPRHPPRFDAVAQALEAAGLRYVRRSRAEAIGDAEVLLLDTLGELMEFYAAADLAFVGGSLAPIGGHNLLEPAALGLPVLAGPHLFSSPDIARILGESGALTLVHDEPQLTAAVSRLLQDPVARAAQGALARAAVADHRGALARLLALIEALPAISR